MPAVRSHKRVYQEPERHDELSSGVSVVEPPRTGSRKQSKGRFKADDSATKEAAKKGGSRHKGTTQLSHKIDAPNMSGTSKRRAHTLRRALVSEIKNTVGGGHCGITATLLCKFAALKTAAAEEAFARGDHEQHRKLTESARMDLLYARETAAKEAVARSATRGPVNPLAKWAALKEPAT